MVFPTFHAGLSQNEDADVVYHTSVNNPDVFADAGSPGVAKLFKILILPNVVIGSDTLFVAFDLVGFPAGSTFLIEGRGIGNSRGRIQGKGGNGGIGGAISRQSYGGGGGGGAGTGPGLGAVGVGAATDGLDGTGSAGGDGGQGAFNPTTFSQSAAAGNGGGIALATRGFTTELFNLAVWGGAGGGAGIAGFGQAGNGGDPGLDGETKGLPGGAAGAAILHSGNPPTESGGTDVRGPTGP